MNTFLMQLSAQAENRFYGHIHLLAKYCGLEGSPWINGYLQHGWNATDGLGNYLGSKRSANKYVWSKRCENIIKQNGKKNVFAIGAPWLYLADVYPQTTTQINRELLPILHIHLLGQNLETPVLNTQIS